MPASQEDNKIASQHNDKSTSQEMEVSVSKKGTADSSKSNKSTRQQPNQSTSQEDNASSPKNSNPTSEQVDNTTSQQVEPENEPKKVVCRKSTFQINAKVLDLLDKLHLTLQLEMGKANAPFKEVIVEEALVRLLEQVDIDRQAVVSVLVQRQESRDKG
ncbi:hypothetical protein NIES2101_31910 [Calothrix sp. HK-06]|nr:hypothetical protein NIES2101_31910 [Calothrix sp. HK-06]